MAVVTARAVVDVAAVLSSLSLSVFLFSAVLLLLLLLLLASHFRPAPFKCTAKF